MEKKFKLLLIPSIVALSLPLTTFSSCGNNIKKDYSLLATQLVEQAVQEFFEICKTPHPSYNLDGIREYYKSVIEELGSTFNKDTYGNVWFDMPATLGYENYPKIILQGHMDMVYAGPAEDKTKPIIPEYHYDGHYLTSKGKKTSLGADNGIGVGLIIALLKNPGVNHGPIRVLLTADEEPGMVGAAQLPSEVIDSNYLISLDGEVENGGFYTSCAGGCCYSLDKTFTTQTFSNTKFCIKASGFKGGHSGNDIGKLRGNAERLLFEGLNKLIESGDEIQLIEVNHKDIDPESGEERDYEYANNTIIPQATVIFTSTKTQQEIEEVYQSLINEYKSLYVDDQDIMIENKDISSAPNDCLDFDQSLKIIKMLAEDLEYGVISPTPAGEEIAHPEHSSNIGPTTLKDGKFNTCAYARGTTKEIIEQEEQTELNAFINAGFDPTKSTEVKLICLNPAWEKNPNDKIIKLAKLGFENSNVKWYERDTNGGVEPAIFIDKKPSLQQTCLGTKFENVHTVNETCYLDPFINSTKALLYMLENLE